MPEFLTGQDGIRITENPTLGDPLFTLDTLHGLPAAIGVTEPLTHRVGEYMGIPRPPISEVDQLRRELRLALRTIDHLADRVAALEARTIPARWARLVATIRRWLRF